MRKCLYQVVFRKEMPLPVLGSFLGGLTCIAVKVVVHFWGAETKAEAET